MMWVGLLCVLALGVNPRVQVAAQNTQTNGSPTQNPTTTTLYMKEKLLTYNDQFHVIDEKENVVYKCEEKLMTWGDDVVVNDADGKELAHIKQTMGSLVGGAVGIGNKFVVTKDGNEWATITKENLPYANTKKVSAKFNDENGGVSEVSITGDTFADDFEFKRGEKEIGTIHKKYFALSDQYALEFPDEEDALAMVVMLVSIHLIYKKHDD